MGRNLARPVVRKSLAAGADELVLVEGDDFEDLDSYTTAYILSSSIKKVGDYNLILCGRQAADTDAGLVGSGIAEILGIPSVTIAQAIEVSDGKVRVERVLPDGYAVIEAEMPVLVTASNEIGELRSANLAAIMAAQKKSITVWNSQDLGIDPSGMRKVDLTKLFIPDRGEPRCEYITGETLEEAGANLATKLAEVKLLGNNNSS
jgi:electron transfer flavoprotein beta subunit